MEVLPINLRAWPLGALCIQQNRYDVRLALLYQKPPQYDLAFLFSIILIKYWQSQIQPMYLGHWR